MSEHLDVRSLEREARDAVRLMRCALDDLCSILERLCQRRAEDAARGRLPEHALVIENGPNGRPEVLA